MQRFLIDVAATGLVIEERIVDVDRFGGQAYLLGSRLIGLG